jgi:hypothetical protein
MAGRKLPTYSTFTANSLCLYNAPSRGIQRHNFYRAHSVKKLAKLLCSAERDTAGKRQRLSAL